MSWKIKGSGDTVKEVWEDLYGNLWFVTDSEAGDGDKFGYVRLYNMPDCAEWGYFNIEYLKQEIGEFKLWKVTKENWGNINTYEEGLLMEVNQT